MKTSAVQTNIRHLIMQRILATEPGLRIPVQDVWCKDFGVSRTLLREVLTVLEYLNVITVRPKTGTTVNPPAVWRTVNQDVIDWQKASPHMKESDSEPSQPVA